MIELEKTYLAKYLPLELKKSDSKEIIDIYIPANIQHAHRRLRIRKNGNDFEITKKMPIKYGDASAQKEQTIVLNEEEYEELNQHKGKRVRKIRHYFPY